MKFFSFKSGNTATRKLSTEKNERMARVRKRKFNHRYLLAELRTINAHFLDVG